MRIFSMTNDSDNIMAYCINCLNQVANNEYRTPVKYPEYFQDISTDTDGKIILNIMRKSQGF